MKQAISQKIDKLSEETKNVPVMTKGAKKYFGI